jgi:hypothetical protein
VRLLPRADFRSANMVASQGMTHQSAGPVAAQAVSTAITRASDTTKSVLQAETDVPEEGQAARRTPR